MWKEIEEMRASGIIEESHSNWCSPVVMVKKPNVKYRFCIDFRKVNAVTKRDAYPIPNMSGILDELRQAHYITTLDLSQAYFQIPLEEKSREITAFVVPGRGLWQFKRMPYGLTNAPATFQRLLDYMIGTEMYPHAFVYLDDIIIITRTFEEHLYWLGKVLDKLRQAELVINREKSEFCCAEVKYLGFLVNSEGLHIDPEKMQPVAEFPAPLNLRQLRRFLGMASWYRRFIPNFATIAEPLTRLMKKRIAWTWSEEQEEAFSALKEHLTSSPTLTCPDFECPFTLQTDASSVGLGAVLTQEIEGVEKVIAYASRALTEAERNYTVTEQECLAVLWAIQKFRCYLEGYKFTVITDHSSLRWLHHLRNPTGRLARWALGLLEYDYEIVHRKGALHHVPDALSRAPEGAVAPDEETIVQMMETQDKWYRKQFRKVEKNPDRFPDYKIADDQLYRHCPRKVISLEMRDEDAWKMVIPRELRYRAISEAHSDPQAAHLGMDKTYRRVFLRYFWPNMWEDIVRFVSYCDTCQKSKVEQLPPSGLMGRRVIEKPWMTIAADVMGSITRSRSGFKYILVIQDLFTKWIEIVPLRVSNGKKISEAIEKVVLCRYGVPRALLTDNGLEFVNKDVRKLVEKTGMRHQTTPPYHPQGNPVERVNRVVKTMLRAFTEANHQDWDLHLHDFQFAYNTAHHSSLKATPAFLNHGRELEPVSSLKRELEGEAEIIARSPEEWKERMQRLDVLRKMFGYALAEAQERQAQYYNLRRRNNEFEEGEVVLRKTHALSSAAKRFSATLVKPFEGPFIISRKLSSTRYELVDFEGNNKGVTSGQDLKRFKEKPEDQEA